MRVPNLSFFTAARNNLGNITSDRYSISNSISTGKKIDGLADNPSSIIKIFDINATMTEISQYSTNLNVGKHLLQEGEASLTQCKELLNNVKTLCSKAINGHLGDAEYSPMVTEIETIINEFFFLSNKSVNGNHIFSGTKTNNPAFVRDDPVKPTKITYNGNDKEFAIKFDEFVSSDVGKTGDYIFENRKINIKSEINDTIVFKEIKGKGINSDKIITAKIPEGEYLPEELVVPIKLALDKGSKEAGYGITYDVKYDSTTGKISIQDDGKTKDLLNFSLLWNSGYNGRVEDVVSQGIDINNVEININNNKELTVSTKETITKEPFVLEWSKMNDTSESYEWKLTNFSGYNILAENITGDEQHIYIDIDGNGDNEIEINLSEKADKGDVISFHIDKYKNNTSVGADIGFDESSDYTTGEIKGEVVTYAGLTNKVTIDSSSNKIDFRETNSSGEKKEHTITIPTGNYTSDELALAIEIEMEKISRTDGNSVNYSIIYDKKSSTYIMKEEGNTLSKLDFLWATGPNRVKDKGGTGTNIGELLGFGAKDVTIQEVESEREINVTIFNTLFELKDAFIKQDRDVISKLFARVDMHFDHINGVVSEYGGQYKNIERKFEIFSKMELTLETNRSELEDTNAVEAYTKLQQIDTAYQAALSATSKIMQLSLVDYLR